MFKFDTELIEDRLCATSFAFFTDEEIKKISVSHVMNTTAFDALGKALPNGIYDKKMGVSPFDHNANCVTCGLESQFCPGHVGHIELTAVIYNPFLINHLHKLLKSMCIHCHRFRMHEHKQEFNEGQCVRKDVYVKVLKLLKAGDVIQGNNLKQFFLHTAKELKLILDSQEIKNLQKVEQKINEILERTDIEEVKQFIKNSDKDTIAQQIKTIQKKANKFKDKLEKQITNQFNTLTQLNPPSDDNVHYIGSTSIMNKALKECIHEIWQLIIPQNCPHCQKKSPSFRKDGHTKFFQKAFSEKVQNQIKQQKRIRKGISATTSVVDDRFDIASEASTRNEQSRKHSKNIDNETTTEYENLNSESEDEEDLGKQKYLTPIEVKDFIDQLWAKERDLLELIFGRYYSEGKGEPYKSDSLGSDMFFLNYLIVPPNRFRPESQGGFGGSNAGGNDSRAYLHAHSGMLNKILNINLLLKDALLKKEEGESALSEITQRWIALQDAVNRFMDSSMASKKADKDSPGIKQLIEKKDGMFRMKMMGKRVNFGARSVISPDPYLSTDELGVPVFMAKKLTFQESVCDYNLNRLRQNVINGHSIHPGANIIEDEETGQKILLETQNLQQRKALASLLNQGKKIVYRHLQNGDVLLFNRQPTLHKPSIMAHLARILPKEQTIRFHYANCSTYNADFDGDEMNIHFPQNYLAISEGYKIMATHKQYIVPTSGKPIRGLIQDSVVAGVFLTSKDTFLTKEQYHQLVYTGLRELLEKGILKRVHTLEPTIYKPKPLYTGKQVISTLLKNIVDKEEWYKMNEMCGLNLNSKAKVPGSAWGSQSKEEGDVIIRDNELLQGTFDKGQFGASEYGLVHSFYEVYGSEKAGVLLTALARVFVQFLQTYGFTCSLEDLVLTKPFEKKRRMLIEKSFKEGIELAADFCGLQNFKVRDYNYSNRIVFQQQGATQDQEYAKFNKQALPENPFEGKKCIQLDNHIRKLLEEKYNTTEDIQKLDSEFDGVIKNKMSKVTSEVLKLCVPDGLVRKFPKNYFMSMVISGAKGSLVNMTQIACMLGQQELEGKRVPKMQNGKTLPCFLPYDPNPRANGYISDKFITGLRPQEFYFHCMAGREGLIDTAVKTSRSGYLQRCLIKQLETLVVNYDMTVRDHDGSIVQFLYGEDSIDVMNTKFLQKFDFLEQNFYSLMNSYKPGEILKSVDNKMVKKYQNQNKKHLKSILQKNPKISIEELSKYNHDPVISKFHPLKYFGSISEKMHLDIKKYLKSDSISAQHLKTKHQTPKQKYGVVESDAFIQMYYLKYMTSLVHPGENVGTIAAHSVGEPSTQMTLNTFHLAGHGAGNMTLGIPRLKEILMTSPINIKTPIMKLFFKPNCNLSQQKMEQFANKFQRIKLGDLTQEVKVSQKIISDQNGKFYREYEITLNFEDHKKIRKNLGIKFDQVEEIFKEQFLPLLMNETLKQQRKYVSPEELQEEESRVVTPGSKGGRGKKKKSQNVEEDEGEEDASEEEDDNYLMKDLTKLKEKPKDDSDQDQEEDDEEDSFDSNIDGVKKSKKEVIGYEQEDESDQEVQRNLNKQVYDQEMENIEDPEQGFQELSQLSGKLQRYIGNITSIQFKHKQQAIAIIKFPLESKKVLMLTLAEQILNKVLVRSVKGIEKCTFVKPEQEGGQAALVIQGINFDAFYPHSDIIDINKIDTNDIWQMKLKYGIEACRANIVKEIRIVFAMYGIEVNYRHLSLIADFIAFNGDYRAFNRTSMEESGSPFLKMSFETTMKYLINACLTKEVDDMTSPSSCLVLGQVPKVGTGVFDIRYDGEHE